MESPSIVNQPIYRRRTVCPAPQNASGNWVKVVQRVPVRLEIEDNQSDLPLRAGMTVSVSIDTERDRSLFQAIGAAVAEMADN